MNVSTLYDKSIKLIDDSYDRLLKIWQLPKGSISKKNINHHAYYYHQYRDGKKVVSKLIRDDEIITLRKQINERKRLIRLNKNAKEDVKKNVKVIAVFDKGLSASLLDEVYAYSFDEIPVHERSKIALPLSQIDMKRFNPDGTMNKNLASYFEKWVHGEIRARDIGNYIIQKISD